jgi:hypothetical protein
MGDIYHIYRVYNQANNNHISYGYTKDVNNLQTLLSKYRTDFKRQYIQKRFGLPITIKKDVYENISFDEVNDITICIYITLHDTFIEDVKQHIYVLDRITNILNKIK